MEKQKQAALESMKEWLADEHELGHAPAKIECAGEFDLHDMHYYIFRYKKSILGRWLLGSCGGYEGTGTENCGHVYSEMEVYDPGTAKEKSIAMIEMIREYWRQQAHEEMERRGIVPDSSEGFSEDSTDSTNGSAPFAGFILLSSCSWDPEKLRSDLLQDWDIPIPDSEDGESALSEDGNSLVWDVDGMMVVVSFMPAPVPGGEAEQNAATNFMWKQAVEVTKTHQAHILVAIVGEEKDPIEIGKLYTKLCCTCCKQDNAIAINTSGTVFQPEFYQDVALGMKEGYLPILDWVYIGLSSVDGKTSGYTFGLAMFGKDEVEVIDSLAPLSELHDFLLNIATYVLSEDVTLRHGETIGFSEDEYLPITRSKSVFLDGHTLKIEFMPAQ